MTGRAGTGQSGTVRRARGPGSGRWRSLASPRAGRVLLAVVFLAVVLIVFAPGPPAADSQRWLAHWLETVHRTWMPRWVTFDLIEFVSNVVMFVPLGFLGVVAAPRLRKWVVPACVLFSGLIELFQYLLLPARQGSWADIAANSLGAVIGMLAAGAVLRRVRRRVIPYRD